jgi:hypothetical protein
MAYSTTTNAALRKPVDEGIGYSDLENLQVDHAANMDILEKAIAGFQTAATTGVNASVINTNGNRTVAMQLLSAGCIATITGQIKGMPFTLIFQSSGSIGMADAGIFKLSAALAGAVNTSITLVWDGAAFIEVCRSANG